MIKDFSSLDRIKYRRWSAVYLADMLFLKESDDEEDRKVWQVLKMVTSAVKSQQFLGQPLIAITVENKRTKK